MRKLILLALIGCGGGGGSIAPGTYSGTGGFLANGGSPSYPIGQIQIIHSNNGGLALSLPGCNPDPITAEGVDGLWCALPAICSGMGSFFGGSGDAGVQDGTLQLYERGIFTGCTPTGAPWPEGVFTFSGTMTN